MSTSYLFDVFISHSSKDKNIVRTIAERLRVDGLRVWFDESEIRPGDSIPAKIEEGLEQSRVLVLCMSAQAFGSDWAQLEAGTFRFRDPLNRERRFIPIRLDDSPIRGSLAQYLYINWSLEEHEQEYAKLLEACKPPQRSEMNAADQPPVERVVQLDCKNVPVLAYAFGSDERRVLTGGADKRLRLWDGETGLCLRVLKSHKGTVRFIEWSDDRRRALIGTEDDRVRLLDVEADRVIADYAKSILSKRQMDCFRLLAGGLSATEIEGKLGLATITVGGHLQELRLNLGVAKRNDVRAIATRLYGQSRHAKYPPLRVRSDWLPHLAWAVEGRIALSERSKRSRPRFRLCSKYGGHRGVRTEEPWSCSWHADRRFVICGGKDGVLRLWDAIEGKQQRAFEGHTGPILSVALNSDQRSVLSGSGDQTVRLWDMRSGRLLHVLTGHLAEVVRVGWYSNKYRAFSGDRKGQIHVWDVSTIVTGSQEADVTIADFDALMEAPVAEAPRQVQYTNAKVLLVGESGVGKSGLSNYLARGIKVEQDKPLPSTDGAWATHWPLRHTKTAPVAEREIWLWDFAGQVDYRLVHQLFMDDTAAAVLVFNPQNENPFEGLGRWDRDLQKAARKPFVNCSPPVGVIAAVF
jgi:WD40 repeat protein